MIKLATEAPVSSTGEASLSAVPASDVCAAIVGAVSRRRFRCHYGPEVAPVPLGLYWQLECEAFERAVDAGRVQVDATHLGACIAGIDASSCANDATFSYDPNGACGKTIVRPDPAGACQTSWECGGAAFCDAATFECSGTCRPAPGLDEPCGPHWSCAYGLACTGSGDGPTCQVPVVRPPNPKTLRGEPCGDTTPQCEPTTRCLAGRCEPLAKHGGACGAVECEDGFCDRGTCAPLRRGGEACASDRECLHIHRCVDGTCEGTCDGRRAWSATAHDRSRRTWSIAVIEPIAGGFARPALILHANGPRRRSARRLL